MGQDVLMLALSNLPRRDLAKKLIDPLRDGCEPVATLEAKHSVVLLKEDSIATSIKVPLRCILLISAFFYFV